MRKQQTPAMRPSRVLAKLRAGQAVSSFKINLDSARAAELAALAGFDCVWACMEHGPNDWSLVESQIWAAKCHDVDVLARVARGGYCDCIRPLEMDAAGIMIPHIMSLEDARNVVRMVRFQPAGRRALDSGNADARYCGMDLKAYIKQANRERFVVLQIEDPEPLDELEEIAALPGYDILFFGPVDFSHALGAPGEWRHPEFRKVLRRIPALAKKHGKYAGTICGMHNLGTMLKLGYNFLNIGCDVGLLTAHCRALAAGFRVAARS